MRINAPSKTAPGRKIKNFESGEAYTLSKKEEFVSGLLTSFFNESKFYGDNSNRILALARDLLKSDPVFVAKATIYAREMCNLRTFPTVMCAEIAMSGARTELTRPVMNRVILRPDQLKEIVAYINSIDSKLPRKLHQLRKGIADAFDRFDEYQLAKYNGGQGAVKLKDVWRLEARAKTPERRELYSKLLNDKLDIPMTWETELSKQGNTAEAWDKLWSNNKMNYMAALRNLRNMAQAGPNCFDDVLRMISNPERVARSRQLPFRFLSAYREAQNAGLPARVLAAIEQALDHSKGNFEQFPGRTLIAVDNSGSMTSGVSQKSSISMNDIATVFGALLIGSNCDVYAFGSDAQIVPKGKITGTLSMAQKIARTDVGHATNGYLVIRDAIKKKVFYDRMIFCTDCQWWSQTAPVMKEYLKINPNVWIHYIDLSGYGSTPTNRYSERTNFISGWSDQILKFIPMVEQGIQSQIQYIDSIEI